MAVSSSSSPFSGKTDLRITHRHLKAIMLYTYAREKSNGWQPFPPPRVHKSVIRENYVICNNTYIHKQSRFQLWYVWSFPSRKKLKTDKDYHALVQAPTHVSFRYILYAFLSRSSRLSVWWSEYTVRNL